MKYFVNIKQSYYVCTKKELFYQRLMKKRMGDDGFKTHKLGYSPASSKLSVLIPSTENLFNDYVIEFKDKTSFSKFKLSYKKLLNPSLTTPSSRISHCRSFNVDDDFEDQIENLRKDFVRICENRDRISYALSNLYNINNYVANIRQSNQGFIDDDISNREYNKKNEESLINCTNELSSILLKYNDLISRRPTLCKSTPNEISIEYNNDIRRLQNQAKTIFKNVVDMEIPD